MPSALARQNAMIQTKFPPAAYRDDDTQSVRSEAAGSVSSWVSVADPGQPSEAQDPGAEQTDSDGLRLPPADLKLGPIPEHGAADQHGRGSSAPVTQAARNWVDHANETPAQKRLRKEQEKANRKGCTFNRWALVMVNDRCLCWTPGIRECSHPTKGGCSTRSSQTPMRASTCSVTGNWCDRPLRVITSTFLC